MSLRMRILGIVQRILQRDKGPSPISQSIDWLGGGTETTSGVELTPETALSSTAVLAAVERLSTILAMLPLFVYRRVGDGRQKEHAPKHSLYRLLHDSPNPEITAMDLREMMQASALIRGNAYAEIVRNNYGQPIELWPLRSDKMRLERKGADLWYMVERNGIVVGLRPDQVFHLKGFSTSGLAGLCRTDLCRDAIATGLAQERYQGKYFANSAAPKGVLETPSVLDDETAARLRQSWQAAYSGLENAWRVGILEDGVQFKQVGVSNEDSQLIEGRTFQIQEASRIFGTQPHLMAELSRATFTNIEHQSLEFVKFTLQPWLVRWEQRIKKDLILPAEQDEYFAEFLVAGLLRGDAQSRANFYRALFNMGALSANDIRDLENMNPLGPEGDLYMVPMNMVPASQVLAKAEAALEEPEPEPEPEPVPEPEPKPEPEEDEGE